MVVTVSVRDLCFSTSLSTPSLTSEICPGPENYIDVTEPLEARISHLSCTLPVHIGTHEYTIYYNGWVNSLYLSRYIATNSAVNSSIEAPALPSLCRTRDMSFEMMNNERRSPASRNDVHGCTMDAVQPEPFISTNIGRTGATLIHHEDSKSRMNAKRLSLWCQG